MLQNPPSPVSKFDYTGPAMREMMGTQRNARTDSAPEPNGVLYEVYKYGP